MTASVGRQVDANPLRGAALGSAQPRAGSDDAGGQDLGDFIQAFGRGHEVGVEGVTPHMASQLHIGAHADYVPARSAECRGRDQ
jgi:hypothetical protein